LADLSIDFNDNGEIEESIEEPGTIFVGAKPALNFLCHTIAAYTEKVQPMI
jgi:hypothetical protein